MDDLRIERVSSTRDEASGAVVHAHDLYQGDQKVGSFHVAAHPGQKVPSFKLKGVKAGHVGQILRYTQANYSAEPLAKSDRTAEKRTAAAVGALAARFGSGEAGPAAPQVASGSPASRARQKALCTTEGCGQPLSFVQVRNKHGFEMTHEHCPNCGTSPTPIARRPATSQDSQAVDLQARRAKVWAQEDAVNKALGADGMTPAPDKAAEAPIELDHDRRRVKNAVMALLGKVETPHSPDGKVNAGLMKSLLAKSIASEQHYESLVQDLHGISKEIASRSSFHEHHDQAALMAMYAKDHLSRANDLLQVQATKPRRIDGMRSMLGLEPMHDKHLNTARAMLRMARVLTVHGDRKMHAAKLYASPTPFSQDPANANIPPDNRSAAAIHRAFKRHGHLVPGSAKYLQDRVAGRPMAPVHPDHVGHVTEPRAETANVRVGPFRLQVPL